MTTGRKKRRRKRNGNREITLTTWVFVIIFLCMMGYLGFFVVNNENEEEMIENSYNSRQEILISQNIRGSVLSAAGDVLAQTVTDEYGNETRVYPYGNLFAHIVGYSTKGRMGVESLANYYLINSNSSLSTRAANSDAGVKNQGDSVVTTLDLYLQQVASDEMGVYQGAVIVTEVKTGKILAMVSKPDFDPNNIDELWDGLVNSDDSSVLLNRATQGLYPPGSTFKIVTSLEYIRENPDTYNNYSFNCTGSFYFGDNERIRCYHGTNHGSVNFLTSFSNSCNSSFANIGLSLDRTSFAETLEGLLFGQELPLDLNYSVSSVELNEDTSDSDLAQIAIGQGTTQVTPILMNMITSAVANGGVLMEPYVVDRVINDSGSVVKSFSPQTYGSVMTREEASILTEMMTEVVKSGTAKSLVSDYYTAAGKTGSAEYDSSADSHSWFTGFAPADDPEIAVTVIVESMGSGSDYAVPIAKRIFNAYFTGKAYGL